MLSNGFQILPLPSYLCKGKARGWGHFQNNGAFTLDVKLVLNENLGGIQCQMGDSLMLSEG